MLRNCSGAQGVPVEFSALSTDVIRKHLSWSRHKMALVVKIDIGYRTDIFTKPLL